MVDDVTLIHLTILATAYRIAFSRLLLIFLSISRLIQSQASEWSRKSPMSSRVIGGELSQSVGIMALRIETYASLVIEFERDRKRVEAYCQKPILKKYSAILNGENILLKSYTKGFRMTSWLSMTCPCCMSSEYKVVQPASKAAAAIMASYIERRYCMASWIPQS